MKQAPAELRFAVMAVDVITFGFVDGKLCGLVSMVNLPPHYINKWGFLGGIVDSKENAEEASERILKEKGNLSNIYLEQLYTFSDVNRDKRNRVVSVSYLGLVKPNKSETYSHEKAKFVPIKELKQLAYDHDSMLKIALKRLRGKLAYTTIIQQLLPEHFTLTELQQAYETILSKTFDKRNFRKKFLALNIISETGTMQEGVKNRPAALYKFNSKEVKELPSII